MLDSLSIAPPAHHGSANPSDHGSAPPADHNSAPHGSGVDRQRWAQLLALAALLLAGASSLLHQVKHVLAGHLLTAELWEDAIDAMRAGPDAWMGRDLQRARDDGERIVRAWK